MKVVLCLFRVFSQGGGKALDDFQIRRADQVRAAAQVGNLGRERWRHDQQKWEISRWKMGIESTNMVDFFYDISWVSHF